MGKRILKTFMNNLGFKLLAVAFAFILWLVVYNLNDPIKTKTFTATVSISGTDSVVDMGKWPEIKDSDKTISFSISGKRSILQDMDDSDFYASADLSNIKLDEDDSSKAYAKIDIGCSKHKTSITFNGGDRYLEFSVEDYMQKQFEVKVSVNGNVSGDHALGNSPQANPRVVKIGGPKSIVGTIATASATINVDDNTIITDNQISDRGDLVLLDENGDEVDMSKLNVDSQYQSIEVTVDVLNTKKVPVKCEYQGTPSGGKGVLGVDTSIDSVYIKGSAEALNNITSLDIGPIDINGASEDIETTVDLTGYLPEGVSLVDSSDASVDVVVRIESNATANMTLNSSDISYTGLADGQKLTFGVDKTAVVVSGNESDIDRIKDSTLKGTIDVSGLSAGQHTVVVKLDLDDSKFTWGEIKIAVTITDEGQTDGTGATDTVTSETKNSSESTDDPTGNTDTTGTVKTDNTDNTKNDNTDSTNDPDSQTDKKNQESDGSNSADSSRTTDTSDN